MVLGLVVSAPSHSPPVTPVLSGTLPSMCPSSSSDLHDRQARPLHDASRPCRPWPRTTAGSTNHAVRRTWSIIPRCPPHLAAGAATPLLSATWPLEPMRSRRLAHFADTPHPPLICAPPSVATPSFLPFSFSLILISSSVNHAKRGIHRKLDQQGGLLSRHTKKRIYDRRHTNWSSSNLQHEDCLQFIFLFSRIGIHEFFIIRSLNVNVDKGRA
jgi:hypothetical protein